MEEIKKIEVQGQQYGVADMLMRSVMGGNTQVIEWSHTHNMNDYKDAGTYRIKGERTGNPMDDNLPIMNQGSGHTIEGILYVLDSSLANGSGNSDDCTVTQFLILSNRVGGQEGDMYMRSAYGANKDSLTWKPWEKYQTNMEVGCVSDNHLLNPSNPTEILKNWSGMNHIIDNGIYSGIYFGPKCMVGTGEDNWHISFQNAAAIETFVMVVINNYAAASNARCITQIKFAVTNGGVFSMEKRSTDPGTLGWSQWESVGGGGGIGNWDLGSSNFIIDNPGFPERTISLGAGLNIDSNITIGTVHYDGGVRFTGRTGPIDIYNHVTIEENVLIQKGVIIGYNDGDFELMGAYHNKDGYGASITTVGSDFIFSYGWREGSPEMFNKYYGSAIINTELGSINFQSTNGNKSLELTNGGLHISSEDQPSITIGKNVSIPDNLSFSIADNILTITDGTNTWKLTAES